MVISIADSKAGQLECCIHLHLYPHGLETQNLVVSVSVTLDVPVTQTFVGFCLSPYRTETQNMECLLKRYLYPCLIRRRLQFDASRLVL